MIPADQGQLIVYFKGTLDSTSTEYQLSLNNIHVDAYEGESSVDEYSGAEAFVSTGFPKLLHSDADNDTLVLFFTEDFLDDFQEYTDRWYELTIDGYRLDCIRTETKPCLTRTGPFVYTFENQILDSDTYNSSYNAEEDPPYLVSTIPPNENDFENVPPFPPHADINFIFSEAVPNMTFVSKYDGDTIGIQVNKNTFAGMADYWIALNGDSVADHKAIPFDNSLHKNLLVKPIDDAWPINTEYEFVFVSAPANGNSIISGCVAEGATHCLRPASLEDILYPPSSDATYAPLIRAGDSAMVGVIAGSSILKGVYKLPAGAYGDPGTKPGDIPFHFRTARVRIDDPTDKTNYTSPSGYVRGVYTNGLVNNVHVKVTCNGVWASEGDATLSNGDFSYLHGISAQDMYSCTSMQIKATADGNGGVDEIHPSFTLACRNTPVALGITSPNDGDTYIQPLNQEIEVSATIKDNICGVGISWVKFDGELVPFTWVEDPPYLEGTITHTYTELSDGVHSFTVEAKNESGRTEYETFYFTFYHDEDLDTIPDYWEELYELLDQDPFSNDVPYADADGDGLLNYEEYYYQTDPTDTDTDDDGVEDLDEIEAGTNPLSDDYELLTYFVSASRGSDNYDGHCPDPPTSDNCGPWETLDKVSRQVYNRGNIVKFQRGDVWKWDGNVSTRNLLVIAGADALFTTYGNAVEPPIFDGRAYLDDLFDTTVSWEEENGVWSAEISVSNMYDITDKFTMLVQSIISQTKNYDEDFQRLLMESDFCRTKTYQSLPLYSYCKSSKWESCDSQEQGCKPFNATDGDTVCNGTVYKGYAGHISEGEGIGDKCYDLPENAVSCESCNPLPNIVLYCKQSNNLKFYLNTYKDPNDYYVFTPWANGVEHDNLFSFQVLNENLDWDTVHDKTNVYKSQVLYSGWTMTSCGTVFKPACEQMPALPTYPNPRYCENFDTCDYSSRNLTYTDSYEGLLNTVRSYYLSPEGYFYVNLNGLSPVTCEVNGKYIPCDDDEETGPKGLYFKNIRANGDKGDGGITIDGLMFRFMGYWAAVWCREPNSCRVENSIVDTASRMGIDGNGDAINNWLWFVDGYGLKYYNGNTNANVLFENNKLIGTGSLDKCNIHSNAENAGMQVVYDHHSAIMRGNIVGYGIAADLYLETGENSDIIENNIIFGTGSYFKPGLVDSGTFIRCTGTNKKYPSMIVRYHSNGPKIRNNIVYNADVALKKGAETTSTSNYMSDYQNSFYNDCVAVLNASKTSSTYNNFGYIASDKTGCDFSGINALLYWSSNFYTSVSDYNFWANYDGPEIGWQGGDSLHWPVTTPANSYTVELFQRSFSKELNSITNDNGIGLPRRSSCDIPQNMPPDYYPRNTWPETLADVLAGCFPDFEPLLSDGSSVLIDGGTFSSVGGIYDRDAPDIGAFEFDLPPPDPTGVSGLRQTVPYRIELQWNNTVVLHNKDRGGWDFDLKNYILVKTGGAHSIALDRLTDEFIDYSADPNTNYTYTLYTVDYQDNQSCNKVVITCDPTCDTDIVENTSGGPDCP